MDDSGVILEVNPYTLQLLGYSEDELLGQHISNFLEDHSFLNGPHLHQFKAELVMNNSEVNFIHKDYTMRPVMISGAFIQPDEGDFSGIICIGKDISALKKAEQQLEEKRVQMEHQGRLSALGEMATGMAHEINQPLYIIRLASDCLRDYFKVKDPSCPEAEDVTKIQDQVERANTIITNMRSFARADRHSMSPHNMAEPVNLALSFFREQFRQHDITFSEEIDSSLDLVQADPQKFEQIVVNFLSNARHAVEGRRQEAGSDYQPQVTARLYGWKNKIYFEVEDNGIGMDEEAKRRCMEPFFTTKEVGQGTGLGLSIIHGIITEMAMEINIHTVAGEGSTFQIVMTPVGHQPTV